MLRMLSHGDGGLAVFHGAGNTKPAAVRAVLERDTVLGRPLSHATHSGYGRMVQGASVVIADCGAVGVCDSALAFEFSEGPQRIVVNCGVPFGASPAWRKAACSAAAHSTLDLACDHGQRFSSSFPFGRRRADGETVCAELITSPQGALLRASNFRRSAHLGHVHHRDLFLAAGGHDLRGEDRLEKDGRSEQQWPETEFAIRFHLLPSVRASADRQGTHVLLVLPSREAWQFSSRGGTLSLEESVYLAGGAGPRRAQQIVIRGAASGPQRINWAFRKLDPHGRHSNRTEISPRLPF
jgi:uncharacterized heparinase superfamily protein